jgi:hypothetical protein
VTGKRGWRAHLQCSSTRAGPERVGASTRGCRKKPKRGRGQAASFAWMFRIIMRVPPALLHSRGAANPHETAVCGEPWMSLIL